MQDWIESVFRAGLCMYSRFFVVSRSFLVACFISWLGFALVLHVPDKGLDVGNTEMTVRARRRIAEEENGVLRTRWQGRSCGG